MGHDDSIAAMGDDARAAARVEPLDWSGHIPKPYPPVHVDGDPEVDWDEVRKQQIEQDIADRD